MQKRPLNLVMRGHVRSSFGDSGLKDLIDEISSRFDTSLYIQTWNVVQNGLSWRRLAAMDAGVDKTMVAEYVNSDRIRDIKILDDSRIRHWGNTEGTIGRTPCPVLAWKNMYYGKFVALRSVASREHQDSVTFQMRFDILSNPFSPKSSEIIDFIERDYPLFENDELGEERIRFLRMRCFLGVDNMYMARAVDMYRFISYMYYDMDRILHFHRRTIHQEHIAFHERKSFVNWQMSDYFVYGPAGSDV